jgi:hypothetical protein
MLSLKGDGNGRIDGQANGRLKVYSKGSEIFPSFSSVPTRSSHRLLLLVVRDSRVFVRIVVKRRGRPSSFEYGYYKASKVHDRDQQLCILACFQDILQPLSFLPICFHLIVVFVVCTEWQFRGRMGLCVAMGATSFYVTSRVWYGRCQIRGMGHVIRRC